MIPGRRRLCALDVTDPGDWFLDLDPYPEARYNGVALFCYRAPDGVLNSAARDADWPRYDHIYVSSVGKGSPYWRWDGSVSAPTIAPSIWHKGNSDWHGFFEAGQWRNA